MMTAIVELKLNGIYFIYFMLNNNLIYYQNKQLNLFVNKIYQSLVNIFKQVKYSLMHFKNIVNNRKKKWLHNVFNF